MENQLSERQKKLLRAIIDKYVETAEPIGSETVEKEASLGVSPATIRNEMMALTKMGFLKQPHTSAGRIPTPEGFKFYISQLMDERELPIKEEVAIKQRLWDHRYQFDRMIREATAALAEYTKAMALATTQEGDIYSAGMANILDMPEFYDIDLTKTMLSLIDRFEVLNELFGQPSLTDPVRILFGEEVGWQFLEPAGFVYTEYEAGPKHRGMIGICGPYRLDYASVVPKVRYFGNLISDVAKAW